MTRFRYPLKDGNIVQLNLVGAEPEKPESNYVNALFVRADDLSKLRGGANNVVQGFKEPLNNFGMNLVPF